MPTTSPPARYTRVAQWLHWIIAALIVVQLALAWVADDLPNGARKLHVLGRHKSFGMTVLMLTIVRLLWRLRHTPPELPAGMKPIERQLARTTHRLFYVLLLAQPLTGWLMSSAKNYSVSWFGLFTWPDLIAPNKAAFEILKTTHDLMGNALFAVIVVHVLAAFKHHLIDNDDVLTRMLPFARSERR